ATREGVDELIGRIRYMLSQIKTGTLCYESEYTPTRGDGDGAYTVYHDDKDNVYVVEGPRIEKMLGYTNLDSEKGFTFFQKFMDENGILDELKGLGIQEGDTVRLYGWEFEYLP
ncbi:MAG: Obg family GTPase CgtA, partial [Lachnospiraceae bacterium]|nr:Obg family GTPase CgtA [Lachnospiraceae bacterium]